MPIGYLRSVPKVDIQFDKESYRPCDELRAKVTVHLATKRRRNLWSRITTKGTGAA